MTTSFHPTIAITLGDPAGIGPEIAVKLLAKGEIQTVCRPVVVGDARLIERMAESLRLPLPPLPRVTQAGEIAGLPATGGIFDLANADPAAIVPGEIAADAGKAAVEYVFAACDLALSKSVDAIVTGPLHKESMNLAGFHYAGHTELLAERTKAEKVSMLLLGPKLRVVHVSTHVALEEAVRRVTFERVLEVINLAFQACRLLGIASPRIAVAGLNPHASEHGLFGNQEENVILPAIEAAAAQGKDVSGPWAPDTVFYRAVRGAFDIVVAMYHDQGHIPMKLLAFDQGVNVSIGLPIIRTSVDHGTAFDIAGKGIANEESLFHAVHTAVQMASTARKE